MSIHTQLRDLYSFPGVRPATHIHGLFGDPYAVAIPLRRLSKKRPAESVAPSTATSMTRLLATSAISTPAGGESISRSPFAAWPVECVMP
jgi:hypothetical protein